MKFALLSGIYIHIPFCRKACSYCNFHFSTNLKNIDRLVDAICIELELRSASFKSQPIDTIYFGGGTPSVLSELALTKIFNTLNSNFNLTQILEITLEANPEDVSIETASLWKSMGINRVSIGIQSLNESELQFMHRNHNADQSIKSIAILIDQHFHSVSADLIYGSPLKSDDQWKQEIQYLLGTGIHHLSAYALTVEPKTILAKQAKDNSIPPILDKDAERHFFILQDQIAMAGWEPYEISNYCKPGFRALHNSNYWKGKPYLGVGPSAHSFFEGQRLWNVANNALYIQGIELGNLQFDSEILTEENEVNEYIMTGLRTMEGIELSKITSKFPHWKTESAKSLIEFARKQWIVYSDEKITLTNSGKLWSDHIISQLMVPAL